MSQRTVPDSHPNIPTAVRNFFFCCGVRGVDVVSIGSLIGTFGVRPWTSRMLHAFSMYFSTLWKRSLWLLKSFGDSKRAMNLVLVGVIEDTV